METLIIHRFLWTLPSCCRWFFPITGKPSGSLYSTESPCQGIRRRGIFGLRKWPRTFCEDPDSGDVNGLAHDFLMSDLWVFWEIRCFWCLMLEKCWGKENIHAHTHTTKKNMVVYHTRCISIFVFHCHVCFRGGTSTHPHAFGGTGLDIGEFCIISHHDLLEHAYMC